jgi:RNA methyltransferase, TrmH family
MAMSIIIKKSFFLRCCFIHIIYMLSSLTAFQRFFKGKNIVVNLKKFSAIPSNDGFMRDMKSIHSESNDKFKTFKSLYQKRSKRNESNSVILESHRTVIDAIRNGMTPKIIFLTTKSLSTPLGASLRYELSSLKCFSDICYFVPENLIDKLSDCETCQGVVAIFEHFRSTDLPEDSNIILACDGVSDPGNLGTLIRTSYGLGFNATLCIGTTDPWSPKSIRSSMGAIIQLPIIETDWVRVAEFLKTRRFNIFLAVLDETAVPYYDVDYSSPSIIVIGSEGHGISKEALAIKNAIKIYIPMGNHLSMSLNAAVAGSIIMAEAMKQRYSMNLIKGFP